MSQEQAVLPAGAAESLDERVSEAQLQVDLALPALPVPAQAVQLFNGGQVLDLGTRLDELRITISVEGRPYCAGRLVLVGENAGVQLIGLPFAQNMQHGSSSPQPA